MERERVMEREGGGRWRERRKEGGMEVKKEGEMEVKNTKSGGWKDGGK